jgi:hypothetical protein
VPPADGLDLPERSRVAVVAVVLALVAVLAATAAVVVTDDHGAPSDATAATTTVPGPSPTTTAPSRTSVPDTGYVSTAPAALLPGLDDPRSVYVVSGRDITRIELDTGRYTTRRALPRGTEHDYPVMWIGGGWLWVETSVALGRVPLDLSADWQMVASDRQVLGMFADGAHWVQPWDEPSRAVLEDVDGNELAEYPLQPGIQAWSTTSDRLVVSGGGRIYTVDRAGRPSSFGTGDFFSATGDWLLWRTCDEQQRCALLLGAAQGLVPPRAVPVDGDPSREPLDRPWSYLVSPDGRWLVMPFDGRVIDLVDGHALRSGPSSTDGDAMAWHPEGGWLLQTDGFALTAYAPDTGVRVSVDLPHPTAAYDSVSVLAVG